MKQNAILNERINSLNKRTFAEDDIKLLLIELRENLSEELFLREISDFVAHPKRNKGICHNRIDSRYGKMKFVREAYTSPEFRSLILNNPQKPWSFFSDYALSYIKAEKIDKQLFEIIIMEGIEEIDDILFVQKYQINKEQVRNLVTKSYKKVKGEYILNNHIVGKQLNFIEDLLKFIRGTITGKPVFTQHEVLSQLNEAINRIQNNSSIEKIVLQEKTLEEIMLCIICILHNVTFELFDGTKGLSKISIDKNLIELNDSSILLAVETNDFTFPILTTELKIKQYLDIEVNLNDTEAVEKYIYAIRNDDGKLELKKHWA